MNTVTTPTPLAQALNALDPTSLSKLQQASRAALLADTDYAHTLGQAAIAYFKLKNGLSHPEGKFDAQCRFYLSAKHQCCLGLRAPSRAYPFSLMSHGRSAVHVAAEWDVKELDLKRAVALIQAAPALRTLATAK